AHSAGGFAPGAADRAPLIHDVACQIEIVIGARATNAQLNGASRGPDIVCGPTADALAGAVRHRDGALARPGTGQYGKRPGTLGQHLAAEEEHSSRNTGAGATPGSGPHRW